MSVYKSDFITIFLLIFTDLSANSLATRNANRPGGAACDDDKQCWSNLCYDSGVCAPDGPLEKTVVSGGLCLHNRHCYSGHCTAGICAPDSKKWGKVAAGGLCLENSQCYCNACIHMRCGPDTSVVNKTAAGGECTDDEKCFSGYCHRRICSPQGDNVGKVPGGGHCLQDKHCASGACTFKQHRCAPEHKKKNGTVADGGQCYTNEHCHEKSVCSQQLCVEKAKHAEETSRRRKPKVGVSEEVKPRQSGAWCTKDSECVGLCVNQRCVTVSRFHPSKIADGGICSGKPTLRYECQSGNCHEEMCAASYYDSVTNSASAAGSECARDDVCFSGLCFRQKCSPDSPAPVDYVYSTSVRHRRQVAAGGRCMENDDCYSAYCDKSVTKNRGVCGADSPRRGKVASGGVCRENRHCYSDYCRSGRCMASAGGSEGKVAPGGQCNNDDKCAYGVSCLNQFCRDDYNTTFDSRPAFKTVKVGRNCGHSAQCETGLCLEGKCTPLRRLSAENHAASVIWNPGYFVAVLAIAFCSRRLISMLCVSCMVMVW